MDYPPLGDYEQLLRSEPYEWTGGTVVHGSQVLDDLVAGIERHRDTDWTTEFWGRLNPTPAALGCVPWLTDQAVAEALASLGACCVVADKQQPVGSALGRLAKRGTPLISSYLDGFEELALPDDQGSPPVIL